MVKYLAWTSEMDQCLAKILVQQVKIGNKVDGVLKPEAYNVAVTEINENFGINLTKEHVRNRLKTWRKQFGILKEILAHKEFYWDEKQKMVVGDNSVWNSYIKTHSDARSFRSKSVDYYDELCIIIGNVSNGQATETDSDDAVETNVDLTNKKDKESVETRGVSEIQSDNRQNKNLRWTEEMDCCLGNILVGQMRKGCTIDKVLQSDAYETAFLGLKDSVCPEIEVTKDHIRNRLRTWKKHHGIMKELLSNPGFKWDGARKMVVANDSVWNNYIQTHPDARIYRSRAYRNHDQLCIIFGDHNSVVEAVDMSPIQFGTNVKDQGNHIRWTDEMDCYLGKILVEQVILGNKNALDNGYTPAAYEAAALALNERFQLHLTSNHVRNHFNTWKKQFDCVKKLLDQREFEWDSKQKMVIAKDAAWNEYIKRDPDARLLQGLAIKNYDELCIIIGYDDPPESSLHLTRDDDPPESSLHLTRDDEAIDTDEILYNQSDRAKEKVKYITWTDDMDHCLIEVLIDQRMLGNKLEKYFKPVAYATALTVLNEKFSLDMTKDNIKNRLRTWKKQYAILKELLSHSGFEWDENRKMVVATDSEWDEYIEKHPDAKQFRAKTVNYNELCMIFGIEQASQHWSESGTKIDANPPLYNELCHVDTPVQMLVDEEMSHENNDSGTQGSSQQTRDRPPSSSHSKQLGKRKRTSDAMLELMNAMAANVARIADALTESNKSICLSELFEMVQNIPGFDDDLIIDACEYLSLDEKRQVMFMKLDARLREKWLLKRLRGQTN